ncbi:hypothetical protein AAH211_21365 [Serratia fonticola]|uniref:hypothetical protein n=1 Tax=Serratia fonticola TaxID=47917 RepID=UPI003985F162
MAKSDWRAIQKLFVAEHARTGVSPKARCEAQGLRYSSAKRHINIGSRTANLQQKAANKNANGGIRKTERKLAAPEPDTVETPNLEGGRTPRKPKYFAFLRTSEFAKKLRIKLRIREFAKQARKPGTPEAAIVETPNSGETEPQESASFRIF